MQLLALVVAFGLEQRVPGMSSYWLLLDRPPHGFRGRVIFSRTWLGLCDCPLLHSTCTATEALVTLRKST